MFSIDDRAGNVITTVIIFLTAAFILYLARVSLLVVLGAVLFAHLLEPAVAAIELHSPLGRGNRNAAIAQVYLFGTLIFGGLAFVFGSSIAGQVKSFHSALPQILQGFSPGQTLSRFEVDHGMNVAQQVQINGWIARNHDVIAEGFRRGAAPPTTKAALMTWGNTAMAFARFRRSCGIALSGICMISSNTFPAFAD
ncbi:MAG: hypothetical protein WCC27_20100 [Acidobacteriaceae bacterium]